MNTDKLLAVLNHINCEGYESSEWGVRGNMDETPLSKVFPVDSNQNCPNNFIWLWLDAEQYEFYQCYCKKNNLLYPDMALTVSNCPDLEVILIWNLD